MSRYETLFHIHVQHDFFEGGRIRNLKLVPAQSSEKHLTNLGLLSRPSPTGCTVFHDASRPDALQQSCADPDEPLVLAFIGTSGEENFSIFTDSSPGGTSSVFWFDNRSSRPAGEPFESLHEAEHASQADIVTADECNWHDVSDIDLLTITPDFVVCIHIGESPDAASLDDLIARPPRYSTVFAARRTRWKYYLVGATADKTYQVAGTAENAQFAVAGTERLPDNTLAMTFMSDQPIPLRERYANAPQLRIGKSPNDELLIRELPVASAECRTSALADKDGALISELYINY